MLAELMRLFHTIKGDAGLCRLGFVEPMVHAAEDLLSRVRSGSLPFDAALEQLLLLAMDRLELVISELESGREVPLADFNRLVAEMSQLKRYRARAGGGAGVAGHQAPDRLLAAPAACWWRCRARRR